MTTMPLYWVEYSYLKHPNSYARIVVKTTLLVSFLTVPQNEKQSDWLLGTYFVASQNKES